MKWLQLRDSPGLSPGSLKGPYLLVLLQQVLRVTNVYLKLLFLNARSF